MRAFWKQLPFLMAGILFGAGLTAATMTQPEVVLSFLLFEDFGLLLVLGSATTVTLIAYQLIPRLLDRPLLGIAFSKRSQQPLSQTLTGAVLFGVGWGICGVCPGPAIAGLGSGNWPMLIVLVSMLAGAYVQGRWFSGAVRKSDG